MSLNKITKKHEKKLIKENGFESYTYIELFEVLKRKVGNYITDSKNKYLIFLYDFIKTIENMKNDNSLNNELSNFFFSNSNKIDNLIDLYNNHNEKILRIRKNRIGELKEMIIQQTNDKKWWAWQGYDLGYNDFNENKPKIGIESWYKTTKRNPFRGNLKFSSLHGV